MPKKNKNAPKVNAPADTEAKQDKKQRIDNTNNTTTAQRARLLHALRRGGVSTIQARRDLDIMMPAARIFELKHNEGHEIATIRATEETQSGKPHRVTFYVLKVEAAR